MSKKLTTAEKAWYQRNHLSIPVLHDKWRIVFCYGDPEKVKKILWWCHYPEDVNPDVDRLNHNQGMTFRSYRCPPVIAMPVKPSIRNLKHLDTLSHECCHAVEAIFAHIGAPLGGEIYCQMQGATLRQILQKIKELD